MENLEAARLMLANLYLKQEKWDDGDRKSAHLS